MSCVLHCLVCGRDYGTARVFLAHVPAQCRRLVGVAAILPPVVRP